MKSSLFHPKIFVQETEFQTDFEDKCPQFQKNRFWQVIHIFWGKLKKLLWNYEKFVRKIVEKWGKVLGMLHSLKVKFSTEKNCLR